MACVAVAVPTIDLSAFLPTLSLSIPSPSVGASIPCCNISVSLLLDMTLVNQAIAAIFAVAATVLQPILQSIVAVVSKLQYALNKLADLLIFNCPLN